MPAEDTGSTGYIQHYLDFFQGETLQGMKILVYEHSVVGRDLVVEKFGKTACSSHPSWPQRSFRANRYRSGLTRSN